MGTNFYIKGYPEAEGMSPKWHIGKRSFAGAYCWDCNEHLHEGDPHDIHTGRMSRLSHCPMCGKSRQEVGGACSFSWAMPKDELMERTIAGRPCPCCKQEWPLPSDGKVIVDEYGKEYTSFEFYDELKIVIVEFIDSIGREFC